MENKPLAYRMRPKTIDDFIGQDHLLGPDKPLRKAIESKNLPSSIIFWGPPGCGKTTLAKLISRLIGYEFIEHSAVSAGKDEMRKAVNTAKLLPKKTILFLDEIHRFNKAQQDFLLPYVENGTIILIGATTENPSFEVVSSLLSRSRVFILNRLTEENIVKIIERAIESPSGLNKSITLSDENKMLIANLANGDARSALNILEAVHAFYSQDNSSEITKEMILNAAQKKSLHYDKDGEEHYNIISALHKSMRDSDAQAAIYWTMRMLEGGEDPLYLARRMIRFASEDVGNADPQALQLAVAAKEAAEFIGMPECNTALVQTAAYLAHAPKSNASYTAVLKVQKDIKETGNLPVPFHLRNAPTKLMKDIGYGKGYKYAHEFPDAKIDQQHLPDELKDRTYYEEKSKKTTI